MNISRSTYPMLLAFCMGAMTAAAEVVLTTEVTKVQRFANAAGEVETRFVDATEVIPGDELRYTISFSNEGDQPVDAESVVITNPIPENTVYLEGTAFGAGTRITFSVDGGGNFGDPDQLNVTREGLERPAIAEDYTTIRWVFEPELAPGEKSYVSFNVRLK